MKVIKNVNRRTKELWVYTFPPQAECVILTHPNAHEEQKIKKENLRYNVAQEYKAGEAAGEKNSQGICWSCSPGNSKNFCLGWNQTSCNSEAAEEIMHV